MHDTAKACWGNTDDVDDERLPVGTVVRCRHPNRTRLGVIVGADLGPSDLWRYQLAVIDVVDAFRDEFDTHAPPQKPTTNKEQQR